MEQRIRTERLPNGLEVVVEEIPLLRSVSLGLWVRQGSRHETDEQAGLSHFIEHLVFKGTTNRSCLQIAEAIDSMGGNLDAFTGREYTSFIAKVLDSHFEDALGLLTEVALRPKLDAADMELEREVILEELKMVQDSPEELAHEVFNRTFFNSHPLGRSILGEESTVRAFSLKDLSRFFRENYRPGRMLLAVAGNVKSEDVFEAAQRFLGAMEAGGAVAVESPPIYLPRSKMLEREQLEQVHVLLGANAFGKTDSRRYALDTLNTYLGGSVSSRLFQHVRERLGLAYAINSFTNTFKDCGLMGIYAATSPDRVEQLIEVVLEELREVAAGDIDRTHIERVKAFIKGDVMLGLENTANRMAFLARQMIYFGEVTQMDEVMARLDAVTIEDVASVAREIIQGSPLTVAAVGNRDGWRERLARFFVA
jgi:predicted Zn-dependent peptidase